MFRAVRVIDQEILSTSQKLLRMLPTILKNFLAMVEENEYYFVEKIFQTSYAGKCQEPIFICHSEFVTIFDLQRPV
jgi:hypothetical protein